MEQVEQYVILSGVVILDSKTQAMDNHSSFFLLVQPFMVKHVLQEHF